MTRPIPVQFEVDIPYTASSCPQQTLDLVRPAHPEGRRLPLVVFLHGGGWQKGDKAAARRYLGNLVRSGNYVGAAVNYRLTDQARWPAQLHDCKAAVRWLRAHADRYGIDGERVAVWGESAGAHLALMLGATGDQPALAGLLGQYHNQSTKISALVNFAGIVDLATLNRQASAIDHDGPRSPEALLIGGTLSTFNHSAEDASPIRYLNAATPPVLSIHSRADEIIPYAQSEQLHRTLTALGVRNLLIPVTGARHGQFPEEALSRVRDFLDRELANEGKTVDPSPLHWTP